MYMKEITIETKVVAPLNKVWECWTEPKHIAGWAFATDDWEAKDVENNIIVGGNFKTVMAAKDGSASFDFTGTYTTVENNKLIEYNMPDGRHVKIVFEEMSNHVQITQTFDPEEENPAEMQRAGWQAILNNFKNYVERQI